METRFPEWLFEQIKNNGWSMRELARRSNLAHTSVARVISGEIAPTWDFCASIARPLKMSPISIFRLAGLMPSIEEGMEGISFDELRGIMERLTPKQRRDVLRYAEFLDHKGDG